jgi:hypothetical protein
MIDIEPYEMTRKYNWGSNAGYFIEVYNGWGGHNYFQVGDGSKAAYRYWNTSWSDGGWHYITMVINRVTNKLDLYLDGSLNNGYGNRDIAGFGNITSSVNLNLRGGSDGRVDELRFETTLRDINWINTCYNNQNNPLSFYSIGTEENG